MNMQLFCWVILWFPCHFEDFFLATAKTFSLPLRRLFPCHCEDFFLATAKTFSLPLRGREIKRKEKRNKENIISEQLICMVGSIEPGGSDDTRACRLHNALIVKGLEVLDGLDRPCGADLEALEVVVQLVRLGVSSGQ